MILMESEMKTSAERGPLGLRPKFILDTLRAVEIMEAMQRYIAFAKPIPVEWIEELGEVLDSYNTFKLRSDSLQDDGCHAS